MSIERIETPNAPGAVGPYSQAIRSNGFVFISGQTPIDPATGKMAEGSIAELARQSLKNASAIAQAAGTSLNKAVKTTVFLTDMADFKEGNEEYAKWFPETFPARSCFAVRQLPVGAKVEIEVICEA